MEKRFEMEYTLICKESTYKVEAFDFIEDDGELDGNKCRLLIFKTHNEVIAIRLNYPPRNYREKYTSEAALAIDAAFDCQLQFYSKMSNKQLLDLDMELKVLPEEVSKNFDIYLKEFAK